MGEDDWLEAAYEDRNGGAVDTAQEHICYVDDTLCDECGAYMESVYAMQDRLMQTHNDPNDSYWESE